MQGTITDGWESHSPQRFKGDQINYAEQMQRIWKLIWKMQACQRQLLRGMLLLGLFIRGFGSRALLI